MKLAVTGYVSEQAGSVASANALLLKALLEAGHEVDFFSKPSFVDPRPVVGNHERFRFVCTDNVGPDRFRAKVQQVPLLGFLACRWDSSTYTKLLLSKIGRAHQSRRYDLCLWLGDFAPGRIGDLPMISFAQGPPGTDARSISDRYTEIRMLAGFRRASQWLMLAKLRLSSLGLPPLRCSDHIIVGSEQSRRTLQRLYGVSCERTSALPYPIDLSMFQPATATRSDNDQTLRVLWLGRIIPRKRLDLFLNGLSEAINRGHSVEATIVGGVGFVSGYDMMIEAFPHRSKLTWIKSLPREEVPALLHKHDVLVQPSDEENFGSSVAEAQACGLPVIVGHTNGNADCLCERDVHLADDRPCTLADALDKILQTRMTSPAASRAVAERCFALARVTEQLVATLDSVLSARSSAPNLRMNASKQSIDVIIPTLKRPDHLRRCLEAVLAQGIRVDQVLVGVRADDEASRELIREFESRLPVRFIEAMGVGVVGSMNSCLAESIANRIALIDDDVVIPQRWLTSMIAHLNANPEAVAAGGKDLLMDYPEMRRNEPLVEDVGRIHWFGRITGSHHRSGGNTRKVQVLRGSNILFDGDFLRRSGFERGLRGKGAQVNWELALALQAHSKGRCMIFDPSVTVIHNVAPRHDNDSIHRGIFHFEGTSDIAFNETFVVLIHGRGLNRFTMLLWQVCIGSHVCPGLVRAVDLVLRPKSHPIQRFMATLQGRSAALLHTIRSPLAQRLTPAGAAIKVTEQPC